MERNTYVDALVKLQGQDGAFLSWMPYDHAMEIQENGGLANAPRINLREGEGRVIPKRLLEGLSCIEDIQIRMQANVEYCLN